MVTVRGVYEYPNVSGSPDILTLPLAIQEGDLLLLFQSNYNVDAAAPAGWDVVIEADQTASFINYANLWSRIATGSDPGANVSVNQDGVNYGGSILVALQDAVLAGSADAKNSTSSVTTPTVTSAYDDNLYLAFLTIMGSSGTPLPVFTPPAEFIETGDIPANSGQWHRMGVFEKEGRFEAGGITGGGFTVNQSGSLISFGVVIGSTVVEGGGGGAGGRPTRGQIWPRSGGGSSSVGSRQTVAYVSGSLDEGATETGLVALGPSYRILKVQLNRQGRVRLYDTVAHRDADEARPKSVPISATADHGMMMDVALQTGALTRTMTPLVDGVNFETGDSVPITVENLDSSAGSVEVTLTFIKTEG